MFAHRGKNQRIPSVYSDPTSLAANGVAIEKGANVILLEVNESRLASAESLGTKAVNPLQQELCAAVSKWTDGRLRVQGFRRH